METNTEIKVSKELTQQILNDLYQTAVNAYSRWLDEKEYEDIADYQPIFDSIIEGHGGTITRMLKSPFGFKFVLGDKTFRLSVNSTSMTLKQVQPSKTTKPNQTKKPRTKTVAPFKASDYKDRLYLHDGGECYCYDHAPMSLQSEVEEKRKFNGAVREIWTPRGGWSDMSLEYAKEQDAQVAKEWNLAPENAYKTECETCVRGGF